MAMRLTILLPVLTRKASGFHCFVQLTHSFADVNFALVDNGNASPKFVMSWDKK